MRDDKREEKILPLASQSIEWNEANVLYLVKVSGSRRASTPVWILTDRGTASAEEDFSFVLQQLGRAKVVGDRTGACRT